MDTQIAKLTKEKKNAEQANKELSEQLQAEEDKVNHLNKLKQKLEANLDEVYYHQLYFLIVSASCWPLITYHSMKHR